MDAALSGSDFSPGPATLAAICAAPPADNSAPIAPLQSRLLDSPADTFESLPLSSICAIGGKKSSLKSPKPPRSNPLRHITFTENDVLPCEQQPPSTEAANVSQIYDELTCHEPIPLSHAPAPREHPRSATPDPPEVLPPPFGAGYLFPADDLVSPFDCEGSRVVFSVDSRCEPFNIIRRDVAARAQLSCYNSPTTLRLGNDVNTVSSNDMVICYLRVVINDRPRIFKIKCVVWDTLAGELIISNQTALATGLSIFCNTPELRSLILGLEAVAINGDRDTIGDVPATVATILGEAEDQELMENISPVESLRQAMTVYTEVDDPWVNEELHGPLGAVFGPLPPEPAKVPALEFDVDEDGLRKKTYGNTQPIRLPPTSPHGQDVIDAQWDELKDFNVLVDAFPDIGPGPIAALAFTVPKPGTERIQRPPNFRRHVVPLDAFSAQWHANYVKSLTADRLVVNFGPINEFITIQHFVMPSVAENLSKLSKFRYWAKIDIVKAYWGVPVHPRCRKWLYTIAPGGKCGYWVCAPMGCAPVSAWFQYTIQGVLRKESSFTLCYADDILIGADSHEDLRERIRIVLGRILDAGFRLNPKKCQFMPAEEIAYLGWIIRDGKIYPGPNCIEKLWKIKKPSQLPEKADDKECRQLTRRFLGLILYLGAYIPFHAEQLRPLHDLTKTKDATDPVGIAQRALPGPHAPTPRKFKWTAEADAAWDWAVSKLKEIKPLYAATYAIGSWLALFTDASKKGWGGILVEFRAGDPRPYIIGTVSGTFTGSQISWAVNVKECYSLWKCVKRFRPHLHLHQFVINVDHRNLLWMTMSINEVIVRMATDLQQHRYLMRHISGDSNIIADLLSRAYPDDDTPPSPMPPYVAAIATDSINAPSPSASLSSAAPAENHECSASDSGETVAPHDFFPELEGFTDDELDQVILTPSTPPSTGHVMPVVEDPPILPRQRQGDRPPPQVRNRRRQRQPDAPLEPGDAPDDALPIYDIGVAGPPPPRRITTEHYHILKSFHGGSNPHTGVAQLQRALRAAGYNWDELDEDVVAFVSTCHACQLERLHRRGPAALPYRSLLIPTRLFDVWSFDILGPLEACALTGARYIAIGIEETAKLIMLSHLASPSALELLFFLLDCFKIFGLPRTIRSDLGAAFISHCTRHFCKATGIKHEFGIADRHESDGTVENAASLVWQYLRLAVNDLEKFEVWAPLLCGVQLSCNALARDVLGGASASEIVFNRKIKPMRFFRPEAAPAPDDPDQEVSAFIADQAAMQLRAIHRADNERHRRYRNKMDIADEKADGVEDLDWVRIGSLVSIPVREHQSVGRPDKFTFLRRGPFEVTAISPGGSTAYLIDVTARFRRENPQPFAYPKLWLHPYSKDTQPIAEHVIEAPQEGDIPPLPLLIEPESLTAIVSAHRLQRPVVQSTPNHVRNYEYLVRWANSPHSNNSRESYELVWHTPAFDEFIRGANLTGHVPPSAYALRHRTHVNQLIYGGQVDRAVPIANPEALRPGRVLQQYVPRDQQRVSQNAVNQSASQSDEISVSQSNAIVPQAPRARGRAASWPPVASANASQQSQYVVPVAFRSPIAQHQPEPPLPIVQQNAVEQSLRRSERQRRPNPPYEAQ